MQEDFVKRCRGKDKVSIKEHINKGSMQSDSKFQEIRKTHPNAYMPWTKEQDEKLIMLFKQRTSVHTLMNFFGRKKGGIHSRLVKLGLIDE